MSNTVTVNGVTYSVGSSFSFGGVTQQTEVSPGTRVTRTVKENGVWVETVLVGDENGTLQVVSRRVVENPPFPRTNYSYTAPPQPAHPFRGPPPSQRYWGGQTPGSQGNAWYNGYESRGPISGYGFLPNTNSPVPMNVGNNPNLPYPHAPPHSSTSYTDTPNTNITPTSPQLPTDEKNPDPSNGNIPSNANPSPGANGGETQPPYERSPPPPYIPAPNPSNYSDFLPGIMDDFSDIPFGGNRRGRFSHRRGGGVDEGTFGMFGGQIRSTVIDNSITLNGDGNDAVIYQS